jgi:hypothetical protein
MVSAEIVGALEGMLLLGRIHPEHIPSIRELIQKWNATFEPPESELLAAQAASRATAARVQ